MSKIDIQATVGELVAARPSRSRVFERLGIDYCCGGKRPLAEVCAAKGLDPATVAIVLEAAESDAIASASPVVDAATMSMTELCDHIEATHHTMLKSELPRLDPIVRKVAAVHGPEKPQLVAVARVFEGLKNEMEAHMMKEETILFPMIRQLEHTSSVPSFHCGSITNPIRMMESEHDNAGSALSQLRELTDGFVAPPDACNTYRAMLDSLASIEADMHQHVHKENNILFPRAARREAELVAK